MAAGATPFNAKPSKSPLEANASSSHIELVPPRDRMVHPLTRAEWGIDGRLLLATTWVRTPELADSLLAALAARLPSTALTCLAARMRQLTSTELPEHDLPPGNVGCILVLGHVLDGYGQPSPELLARLACGLSLFRSYPEASIMVSGGAPVRGRTEARVMQDWLLAQGVSPDAVLFEDQSRDTYENVRLSVPLLVPKLVRSVVVVTGASHILRAHSLLSAQVNQDGLPWRTGHVAHNSHATVSANARAEERFLLFKDLGRILGVWDYP